MGGVSDAGYGTLMESGADFAETVSAEFDIIVLFLQFPLTGQKITSIYHLQHRLLFF